MNISTDLQQQFFTHLKNSLPAHLSMADELCEVLGISPDSAYRRIRGEKPLTLGEMKIICGKFKLSLDHVLQLNSDAVVFNTGEVLEEVTDFEKYLEGLLAQFKIIASFEKKEMYYLCKDILPFQFFNFPELAAFKSHFWMRHILMDERLNGTLFSIDSFPFPRVIDLGKQVSKLYNSIDSIEVWNQEIVSSTLHQISYYRDAGLFATESDMVRTYDSFKSLLSHMQLMAERGTKFTPGEGELAKNGSFQLYFNEIILGNNTIMAKLGDSFVTFVNFAALKYLTTRDVRFCNYSYRYFTNMVNKSVLISRSGEKERSRFFNSLRAKMQDPGIAV